MPTNFFGKNIELSKRKEAKMLSDPTKWGHINTDTIPKPADTTTSSDFEPTFNRDWLPIQEEEQAPLIEEE